MAVVFRPEQFEPRRVRLTAAGRSRLTTLVAVLGLLVIVQGWALTRAYAAGIFRAAMLIAPAVVLLGFWMVWTLLKNERELLLTGRLATGRVTETAKSPKGAMVSFEYSDHTGAQHTRTARDITNELKNEDRVPVFYDPGFPGRCSISPGSFYELF